MQALKKAWRSSSLKLDVDFQSMPIGGYDSQLEKPYFKTLEQSVCRDFEVDYGSKEHVAIVFAALDVDKELQSDKVKRQMSISDGRLIVYWENGTVRLAYRHVHMNTLDDEVKSFPRTCLSR